MHSVGSERQLISPLLLFCFCFCCSYYCYYYYHYVYLLVKGFIITVDLETPGPEYSNDYEYKPGHFN